MFSRDWLFWLVVIVVFVVPRLLGKLLSGAKGEAPPTAPLPQRAPQAGRTRPSRPQPVGRVLPRPKISAERQSEMDRLWHALRKLQLAAKDQVRGVLEQPEQARRPPAGVVARPEAAAIRQADSAPPPAAKAPSRPPPPAALTKPRPERASAWAENLRNRHTLRQIIISAEIIGPPKGS
jgi:hypothetical protein